MRDLDSEPESVADCLGGAGYRSIRVRYRQDISNMAPKPTENMVLGRSKSKSPPRILSMHAQQMRMERGFRKRLNFSYSSNSLKSLQMVLNQESLLAHRRASQPFDAYGSITSRDAFPDSLSSSSSSSSIAEDDEDENQLEPFNQKTKADLNKKDIDTAAQDFGFVHLDVKVNDLVHKNNGRLKNGVNKNNNHSAKTNGFIKTDVVDSSKIKETKKFTIMSIKSNERREYLYKILVIGELGTGKTSIIKRYVHQFFSQHYRATIGVDFALKVLNWDSDSVVRLQLWDIAGQERFGNMTRVYYKEAVGAFLVFDVTRSVTFDAVHKWKADLDAKVQLPDGSPIPCILLANKCDQPKEGLASSPSKLDEFVKEKGFAAWFETSAKENVNIEEAATALVKTIMENDKLMNSQDCILDDNKFSLRGSDNDRIKKSCNC